MAAQNFTARRIAARVELLDALTAASHRHGATAAHLLGSLGRQTADAFSDIDAWLTFPDDRIDRVVQRRKALYDSVGDLLLTHEAAGNRPVGGIYTLALYQSPFGPLQVDWYLAPQQTSRVAPEAAVLFEDVPVPRGEWQLDHEATTEGNCRDSVNWLITMLFIAIKTLVRGDDVPFLRFLAGAHGAM